MPSKGDYNKRGLLIILILILILNFIAISVYLSIPKSSEDKIDVLKNIKTDVSLSLDKNNLLDNSLDASSFAKVLSTSSSFSSSYSSSSSSSSNGNSCTGNCGIGSPDEECRDFGFDFGVAKWECEGGTCCGLEGSWKLDEENYPGTLVTGCCKNATWNVGSSPADGIVVKSGNIEHEGYFYAVNGTSGTVILPKDISHITFCGYNETQEYECGNGIKEEDEECDLGINNGVECTPDYGETCTYCSLDCENKTKTDGYCGDGIINGDEECEEDGDCEASVCQDKCIGNDYYEYKITENECDDCKCEENECDVKNISHNDPRCLNEYCGDGIINGDEECEPPNTTTCDANCTTITCDENSDCDDDVFCNGQEKCIDGECKNGTDVDCKGFDLCLIGECNYTDDGNPFTWDYFPGFTSVCDESLDSCTVGYTNLTHECDFDCGAECIDAGDCPEKCTATHKLYTEVNCNECECDYSKYKCIIGKCGAVCDSNDDCTCQQDYCNGTTRYDYPENSTCGTAGSEACLCTTCTANVIYNSTECGYAEPYCGDGNLNAGEECDDGNDNNLDECRNDCTQPFCGDNIIDEGEECEPPNTTTCNANCKFKNLTCIEAKNLGLLTGTINGGQGIAINNWHQNYDVGLAVYEKFDEIIDNQKLFDYDTGNVNGNSNLTLNVDLPDCKYQIDLFCGPVLFSLNGTRYGSRLLVAKTGGIEYCSEEPECGNGILENGEECDDGNNASGDGCDSNCKTEECCKDGDCPGDSYSDKYCYNDDVHKNLTDNFCKNGECLFNISKTFVKDCGSNYCDNWGSYYCEGKNRTRQRTCYDKGCSSGECFNNSNIEKQSEECVYDCVNGECIEEEYCGDEIVNGDEECEFDYQCNNPCLFSFCFSTTTEKCVNCKCEEVQKPYCGDGVVNQFWEQCDNGNLINGDGCDKYCKTEGCVDEDHDCVCDNEDWCLDSKPGEPVTIHGCDPFQFCGQLACGEDCYKLDFIPKYLNCEPIESEDEGQYPGDCTFVMVLNEGQTEPKCLPTTCAD